MPIVCVQFVHVPQTIRIVYYLRTGHVHMSYAIEIKPLPELCLMGGKGGNYPRRQNNFNTNNLFNLLFGK